MNTNPQRSDTRILTINHKFLKDLSQELQFLQCIDVRDRKQRNGYTTYDFLKENRQVLCTNSFI